MPLEIIRNDITKIKADAIVNTANPAPIVGAGTDSAIYAAAGPELLEARRHLGSIAPGHAAATPAFGLDAKYVLHTVSPCWIDGTHGEEAQLEKAYRAALRLAKRLGCASVAFPLMAAGSNGFPRDLALAVAIRTITDFLMKREMTVYLALYNKDAFGLAASLFDGLKSYIDDHYVEQRRQEEAGRFLQRPRRGAAREAMQSYDAADAEAMLDASPVPGAAPAAFRDNYAARPAPAKASSFTGAGAGALSELLAKKESTFSELLLDLLRERKGKDSEVYKRAEISKQLFSKILSNRDYQPTKSTALQLAIGLQLDLAQTQKLLEKAGFVLTRSSKADLVVQYYIERKIYSVSFINEALYDCGLPLLKTGLKQ